MKLKSVTIQVSGTVQGVGFRPFVYRIAKKYHIKGSVSNNASGVLIVAQSSAENIDTFIHALKTELPPLAQIGSFEVTSLNNFLSENSFCIQESSQGEKVLVDVTRDTSICSACLQELFDPADRRFRHPFINCTDCGPRYSIIKALPYDRPQTTMALFALCKQCEKQYRDPADRRFHAQPVCCNRCGPVLELRDRDGLVVASNDVVKETILLLTQGAIVAIKGIGGFHLACRADSEAAVGILRKRKGREEKPFALMVRDVEAAKKYVLLSESEQKLLESIERPIVICRKKQSAAPLAESVAPRLPTLGIMLPYTPLHYLLFDTDAFDTLVMTSANYTHEPLCSDNDEALQRLYGIADYFCIHNRDIHVPLDDSIARVIDNKAMMMRRSRGYVPAPLPAGNDVNGIIGLGGILKSTVTVGRGRQCYVSQYLGTLDTVQNVNYGERVLKHLLGLLDVKPSLYVSDLHQTNIRPYELLESVPLIKVQHHHAHAIACMGENHVSEKCICVVYDGLGLGDDGAMWGGEIFVADRASYTRVAHCKYVGMPGGDAATYYPGRMALSMCMSGFKQYRDSLCPWIADQERSAVIEILSSGVNTPLTSSMGRLFDACAAILDICRYRTYEGQPAIECEAWADTHEHTRYDIEIGINNGLYCIDGPAILAQVIEDTKREYPIPKIAARFHNTIAAVTVEICQRIASEYGITTVCLSGGCFHNKLLTERIIEALQKAMLQPLVHRVLSPGDECISFGQVLYAAAQNTMLGL